jgi:hypothetical protein
MSVTVRPQHIGTLLSSLGCGPSNPSTHIVSESEAESGEAMAEARGGAGGARRR